MIEKWIVCGVDEPSREAFSLAQRRWSALAAVDGFVAQLGGFSRASPPEACILAMWRDEAAFRRFQGTVHDEIAGASGQAGTYRSIAVALFEHRFDFPGARASFLDAVGRSGVLRVADCAVPPDRREHFVQVQRDVWAPAMGSSAGMQAGAFAEAPSPCVGSRSQTRFPGPAAPPARCDSDAWDTPEAPGRFLVTSLWTDAGAHDAYVEGRVPALRERAEVRRDVARLAGHVVSLEPEWTVLPERLPR